ncbi:TolC family protein [Polaribacter ponticola]|uniref:TolC family protein n=1 Tax=Polaribacter ponticola TaxID=2978475 RepID=A0ABT5S684_9FLAO|nr:TolC family protein [Polaribacter sp. MSW5]MDD7913611.1 TolC family protein [Polaribacter sp. MSW5]
MKTKLILFVAIITSMSTFSQQKWTLKECVDEALKKNISIQQNRLSLEIAKNDIKLAKGNFLPVINGSTSGSLSLGSSFNQVTQNRSPSTTLFGGSVGLSGGISLFNGFRNTNTFKQAQLGVESSLLDLKKIENDISLFVVNGYLNILFAKESLNAAKVQYEISKKQIEAAESRFNSGVIPKGDLLNTQSTAATNLQSVITQENSLDLAILNLAQLLQVSVDGFDVASINVGSPSANLLYNNSASVYEKSVDRMPEIERAKLAIENAGLSIEIAKSAYLPSVSASIFMNSSYNYIIKPKGVSTGNFFDQLDGNLGYGLGFSVNVPIFNGFKTDANVTRSKINKEISETRLESEKLSLKQTIEQSFLDVKSALKTFEAARISLEAQKEAFKNAQERYNYGAMTLFDFDQVRTRLVNAEAALIRSKYDYVFKTKVLQFYAGDLVLE